MIHEEYMDLYAPRGFIDVEPSFVSAVRSMINETMGRVIDEIWVPEINKMRFTILKTSSYMNVAEFCQLSEKVKEQLLSYGIDLDSAVDYKNLISDLETWKRDAGKKEKEEKSKCIPVIVEVPKEVKVLTSKQDSVSIVKEVFNGEQVEFEIF